MTRMNLLLLTGTLLTGCGSDSSSPSASAPVQPAATATAAPSPTSFMVATAAALPTCDASRMGQVAYVVATKALHGCDGTAWAAVDLKGEKGDKGDAGSAAGATRIVTQIHCYAPGTFTTGLAYNYDLAELSSGDLMVSATLSDSSRSYSSTAFFAAGQGGSDTGGVNLTYDSFSPADSGWWSFEIDKATLVVKIIYHDADRTPAETFYTRPASDCTKRTF